MHAGPLLFCGDPHGQWQHIIDAALQTQARAVILLGDLEPARPLHIELEAVRERVWFIHGNHDTDHAANFANVWHSELAERNLHGRVVTLPCGTRIAGLGGVFRGAVWYPKDAQIAKFRTAKTTPAKPQARTAGKAACTSDTGPASTPMRSITCQHSRPTS
jgi:Calcineurin-like phosphoesterase